MNGKACVPAWFERDFFDEPLLQVLRLSSMHRIEHRGSLTVLFDGDIPVGRCSLLTNSLSWRLRVVDLMAELGCSRKNAEGLWEKEFLKRLKSVGARTRLGHVIPTLEYSRLYVEPSDRRKGHATALLSYGKHVAIEHGMARLALAYEPKNFPAENLYRKFGFSAYGKFDGEFQHMVIWLKNVVCAERPAGKMSLVEAT